MKGFFSLQGFWINTFLQKGLLFCFAILLYANTFTHDYTQDDAIVIYDNMFTTEGIAGIPGILENDTFFGFFKVEGKDKLVSGGRYRPLTLIMFAIEYEIFGNNPLAFHVINVLFYALLIVLLYQTLILLFSSYFDKEKLLQFAFIASLLFCVHPIHTEVVANIKGRDEIMTLLLSIGTLYLLLKFLENNKWLYFISSLLTFLLALLSKENAITFIAIIPLALILFRKVNVKQHIFVLGGLLGITLVFLFIRASILGWDFGGESRELMNNPFLKLENGRYVDFTFSEKMSTIVYTLGKYIQLLVWPHPLTHDYYPRQIAIMSWTDWKVILSLLTYIALLVFSILRLKKQALISFGILFFFITISIVSNVLFPVGTNMSERFLFMPSVGFVIIISFLLLRLYNRSKIPVMLFLIGTVLLMSFKTVSRNVVWKNDFTLFNTDVKTSNNSAKVLNAAGGSLVAKASGEKNLARKERMLREAISHLNKAVTIHPGYKNAYLIKGNAQFYLKDYESAILSFQQALNLAPAYKEARKNLAISHREAGKFYGQEKNDLDKSLEHLGKAYEMMEEDYETLRLYGIANALSGNFEKALVMFEKGVEIEPGNAGAFVNLGNLYYNIGDRDKGKIYHGRALELDPEALNQGK